MKRDSRWEATIARGALHWAGRMPAHATPVPVCVCVRCCVTATVADINRTFPMHPFFRQARHGVRALAREHAVLSARRSRPSARRQQCLFNVLKAYALFDTDVGYCQGMGFVTGLLLLYMSEEVVPARTHAPGTVAEPRGRAGCVLGVGGTAQGRWVSRRAAGPRPCMQPDTDPFARPEQFQMKGLYVHGMPLLAKVPPALLPAPRRWVRDSAIAAVLLPVRPPARHRAA